MANLLLKEDIRTKSKVISDRITRESDEEAMRIFGFDALHGYWVTSLSR